MSSLKPSRPWVSYGLFCLLVLMLLFLVFGEWGLIHYWRLSGERARLEDQTRALQKENELLREKIHRLGHDDRYLEKIVREELGLAKEGEIVYRFPNVQSKKRAEVTTAPPSESRPSSERSARP